MKLQELQAKVGEELGVSDWFLVDQARIDAFADCTDDHQFIHVNPEMAKATPLGSTVAHGFLTLSLLSAMAESALEKPEVQFAINYGFDKIRFLSFVKSGARVRGRLQGKFEATVEIENETKPALGAEWIFQYFG